MSTLDLPTIVDSLLLKKVKQRNDAIQLLQTYSASKLRLTPRHFVSLSEGLLKLIEIERDIYETNSNAATHQRLSAASVLLRDLLEESLKLNKLRFKHCTHILFGITSCFFLPKGSILAPCAVDFARIVNRLLHEKFFIIHLSLDSWNKCYKFVVKSLATIIELPDASHLLTAHESILTDLLNSLHCLVGGETTDIYEPLILNKAYFPLRKIIQSIFLLYNKRESSVLVGAFKVTNKLLVSLSTEDISFCNCLINATLQPLINFAHTTVDSLLTQIVILINLDPFYRYLSIDHLPELIQSDTSVTNDLTSGSKRQDPFIDETGGKSSQLYSIGVLAQTVLNRVVNLPSKLAISDVGFLERQQPLNWFSLPTLQLKSSNQLLWLLFSGASKLLVKLYSLFNNGSFTNITDSFMSSRGKKIKVHSSTSDVTSFSKPEELLHYMISSNDVKLVTTGVQLLCFVKDHSPRKEQKGDVKSSYTDDHNAEEHTILDIHIGDEGDVFFEDMNLITKLISILNDKNLVYWAMLGVFVIIRRFDLKIKLGDSSLTRKLRQVLKLVIPLIKQDDYSELSCRLFSHIVFSFEVDRLHSLLDSSIIYQLEIILDLTEISGPSTLSSDAINFWWALHWAILKLSLRRDHDVSKCAGRWLLSKLTAQNLDGSKAEVLPFKVEYPPMLPKFISWILGHKISSSKEEDTCSLPHAFGSFDNSENLHFTSFLSLEEPFTNLKLHEIRIGPSVGNQNVFESIIEKVRQVGENVLSGSENVKDIYLWIKLTTDIEHLYKEQVWAKCFDLSSTTHELWKSLFFHLSSQEDFIYILNDMVRSRIAKRAFPDFHFVLRQLEGFFFDKVPSSHSQGSRVTSDTELDDEFSNADSIKTPSVSLRKPITPGAVEAYFNFQVHYNEDSECLLKVLMNCEPETVVTCLSYLATEGSLDVREPSVIIKLIRVLGEGPLSSHQMDRASETISTTYKFLTKILRSGKSMGDTELQKDVCDLLLFLFQCEQKSLFLTTKTQFCVVSLILQCQLLPYMNVEKFKLSDLISKASNALKITILTQVHRHFKNLGSFERMGFYRELFNCFPLPQQSVEKAATYTYFFANISAGVSQIITASLFNMLECSRFQFFRPYLQSGICIMSCNSQKATNKEFFKSLRLDILKSWWLSGLKFDELPYEFFAYRHYKDFVLDNYRQLVSVCIAVKSDKPSTYVLSQLTSIANFKGYEIQSLLYDSLSILVPLAYTSNGVRNEVFKALLPHLNNLYKSYMREQVLIIVLETIRLTDVGSEESLSKVCYKSLPVITFTSDMIIDNSMNARVTPVSSVDLINALVAKFWPLENGDFWLDQVKHFLLRQLGKDVFADDTESRISAIRRIKFMLCQSHLKIHCPESTVVLFEICVALIQSNMVDEASKLLSLISIDALKLLGTRNTFLSIAKAMSLLFKVSSGSQIAVPFISEVLKANELDPLILGPFQEVIQKGVEKILLQAVEFRGDEVETVLIEMTSQDICEKDKRVLIEFLIGLVSETVITDPSLTNDSVVSLLLSFDFAKVSNTFGLWAAKYISLSYLNNSKALADFGLRKELPELNEKKVTGSIASMNFFVDQLLTCSRHGEYDEVSFAEAMLGAILWRHQIREDDTSRFLDFENAYLELRGHIVPIDIHSCLLVVSSNDSLEIKDESVDILLETFESLLEESTFEDWAGQLLLSILREIGKFTSLASLFASCVIRYPSWADSTLPFTICYYITLIGTRAAQQICDLVDILCRRGEALGIKGTRLLAKVVLSIRIASKQDSKVFKDLYLNLDLASIFSVLNSSTHSRTALMIFEDLTDGDPQNVDWSKWRQPIMNIYESIDDADMLFGIPQDASLSSAFDMAKRTGSTTEILKSSLASLDVAMMESGSVNYDLTMNALLNDGLMGMSKLISTNSSDDVGTYEWSWKLSLWDLPISDTPSTDNELIFNYLKRLQRTPLHETALLASIYECFNLKSAIMNDEVSMKTYRENSLRWLVALSSIIEANSIISASHQDLDVKIASADQHSWFDEADMRYSENILLCRREAFRKRIELSKDSVESYTEISKVQESCWQGLVHDLLKFNYLARQNGHSQKMLNSAVLMDKVVSSKEVKSLKSYEAIQKFTTFSIAHSLWHQGNFKAPIAMLKSVIESGVDKFTLLNLLNVDSVLITSRLVEWLAASREELGDNLLRHYVEPIEDTISQVDNSSQKSQAYKNFARFCESQFKAKALEAKVMSLKQRMKRKTNEIEEIKLHYGKTAVNPSERKSVQKYYNRLKSQIAADGIELESLADLQMTFGSKSTIFYLNALIAGDEDNESVDRFISLFLELSMYEPLQTTLKEPLLKLPSYKSLSWAAQLMARLSNDKTDFQASVQLLIFNICHDHPFHSLYLLFSLLQHREVAQETSNTPMLLRVAAAEKVRRNLVTASKSFSEKILQPVEKLCEESVALAKIKSSKGKSIDLKKLEMGRFWLEELPHIPPPILDLPVLRSGYDNAPRMFSADSKVSIATSGLSLPKIIQLNLSDGSQRKMLLKHGTDDLRQDATMEQVFEKVNSILCRDRETRKRKLSIKTYKAVPLGPKAGVIEFVPNSKALIEVVRPYHQKQDQLKYEKAKEMMKNCQSSNQKERIQVYESIIAKVKPVLHRYFRDHYLTPDHWYDCRQRYTKGVATSSMIGHILGLGDRHCNNILLEESTGTPVHIDLGVAFDQGKRLPIPETVPFRLTRDIVDGFGITGVHGAFDKLCEHTFRVLKEHKDHILAILDALRWDPLHLWSISPLRKKRLQDDSKTVGQEPQEDGSEANAAMLTVIEKLDAGGLSVEATVRQLIKEATSTQNLALIYCGWCPFF